MDKDFTSALVASDLLGGVFSLALGGVSRRSPLATRAFNPPFVVFFIVIFNDMQLWLLWHCSAIALHRELHTSRRQFTTLRKLN